MAKTALQQITARAKQLRRANPKMQWVAAVKKASQEYNGSKKTPRKKAPVKRASVAGVKAPKKAAPKVQVKAKRVNIVAGIGATSSTAMRNMNAYIAGISSLEKKAEQLKEKIANLSTKEKAPYKAELKKNNDLKLQMKRAKNALKKFL